MERIGYIDAMRGMTMLLVVYSHVCHYCMGDTAMGGNDVMFLFRLPCFFFISGWLFGKNSVVKPQSTLKAQSTLKQFNGGGRFWEVLRHKLRVQIVPTVVFLLLLVSVDNLSAPANIPHTFFNSLGATKGGYWFTVALFEFFVIYMLSSLAWRKRERWKGILALVISVIAFCYDVYYSHLVANHPHPWIYRVLGFLGVMTWRYYFFFYVGTLTRKHFDRFLRLTENRLFLSVMAMAFVAAALLRHDSHVLPVGLSFFIGGTAGMILVYAAFRRLSSLLTKEWFAGRWLQFVGTRTLDIYLLHYFFLPRCLLAVAADIRGQSELLAVITVSAVTLVVTALCLLASAAIRRSSFLAYWLFGAKTI